MDPEVPVAVAAAQEAVGRNMYACRLVPLLMLTLYNLFPVLRIPSSNLVSYTADAGMPPSVPTRFGFFLALTAAALSVNAPLLLFNIDRFALSMERVERRHDV
jgi:hypothetical protein